MILISLHLVHEVGVLQHGASHLQKREAFIHDLVGISTAGDTSDIDERKIRHCRLKFLCIFKEKQVLERHCRSNNPASKKNSCLEPPLLPREIMYDGLDRELTPHNIHRLSAHKTS